MHGRPRQSQWWLGARPSGLGSIEDRGFVCLPGNSAEDLSLCPFSSDYNHGMAKNPEQMLNELRVIRSQRGDALAFEQLLRRWTPSLHRFCKRAGIAEDDAPDVVQEVWHAVVRRLPDLQSPSAFSAWLFRIATARCADHLRVKIRRRRAEPSYVSGDPELPADEILMKREMTQDVHRVLGSMDFDHRVTLLLHYIEGFSVKETAEIVGVPAGTIRSRLHHARLNFKHIWEARHE